jgi:hypothetical protein
MACSRHDHSSSLPGSQSDVRHGVLPLFVCQGCGGCSHQPVAADVCVVYIYHFYIGHSAPPAMVGCWKCCLRCTVVPFWPAAAVHCYHAVLWRRTFCQPAIDCHPLCHPLVTAALFAKCSGSGADVCFAACCVSLSASCLYSLVRAV